jgi:hypothetical protein
LARTALEQQSPEKSEKAVGRSQIDTQFPLLRRNATDRGTTEAQ